MVARGNKWEEGARMGKTHWSNDLEEIERCVNIDLGRIRIWLAANKLTLNTTKTISVKWVQVKTGNAKKESHN